MNEEQLQALLESFKQGILEEVKSSTQNAVSGLAADFRKEIKSIKEKQEQIQQEQIKPAPESEESQTKRDTIAAVKAKYEADMAALTEKVGQLERERTEEKQRAFQKHRDSQVLKLLVDQGFEDANSVLDIFNLKYSAALIPGEDDFVLYKPSEESEPKTLEAVVQEFKQSPVGKRWLPASMESVTSGADLPTNKTTNPPEVQSNDPREKLQRLLQIQQNQ